MASITNTVIARNISGGEYEVVDLRIGWPDTESVILTDKLELHVVRLSEDLEWAVANDKVVLNNGTEDLSKAEAQEWFDGANGGFATLDEDGNIPPTQVAPAIRGFWLAPGGDQNDYITSTSAAARQARRNVIFDGTDDLGIPTSVDFLVSAASPDGNGGTLVRLVHESGGGDVVLAAMTTPYTHDYKAIVNVAVTGTWPTGKAVIRVDMKKNAPANTTAQCHSIKVIY